MKFFAYMEKGIGKKSSEDTILIGGDILKEGFYVVEGNPDFVAVADGVGGNAGGHEASEFVMSKVRSINRSELRKSMFELNDALVSFAKAIPGKEKMATTFSGLCFSDKPCKVLHIGNTRVFATQGIYLKQLTSDHTIVEWLRTKGQYEAAESAATNEITACFGGGNNSYFQQFSIEDLGRDYRGYVLTSDGIHDYLETEELEDFFAENDFSEEAFVRLANRAKENGSVDDKSIVVIMRG